MSTDALRRRLSGLAPLALLLAACAEEAADPPPPDPRFAIETVASGLEHPWGLAFLPDGDLLVTERAGRLRRVSPDGAVSDPIPGVPAVHAESQGGLMGLALAADFEDSGIVYLSFAEGDGAANTTALHRARLTPDGLVEGETIFRAAPMKDTDVHYGGRIAVAADGSVFLTLGDGYEYREEAQRLDNHLGAIVRLTPDGAPHPDNPFAGRADARPEIFSYGHRNVQGIAIDAESGRIWAHEHGPDGGDELNILEAGANYGWPIATAGDDYTGGRISPFYGHDEQPGLTAPVWGWTPSIAPSGLALYEGALFPDWRGDLLISALSDKTVRRIDLENGRPGAEEVLFAHLRTRFRHVAEGPDGAVYLLTDAAGGAILRVTPADAPA